MPVRRRGFVVLAIEVAASVCATALAAYLVAGAFVAWFTHPLWRP